MKNKLFNFFLTVLCGIFFLQSALTQELNQRHKGATPLSNNNNQHFDKLSAASSTKATTRAVIVGISKYQDPKIPDLHYADRDAELFGEWLKSPAGGKVSTDNVILLTNENATSAQVNLAFNWLADSSKEGDIAIIYFSGHADLDSKKRLEQFGYLLTYDTPSSIYIAGSAPLNYLQNIVSTLSNIQKVKVELFLDVCHAGKFAGTEFGLHQATAQALTNQFANEIKILSCQPDQFSLEGQEWGGGRGVFSYHLIEGLTGLADKNNDGQVNLFEIGRFLEDIVPSETSQSQMPKIVGNSNTVIAWIDPPSLAALRRQKETQASTLDFVGSKGIEDDVLAKADSISKAYYFSFKKALKDKILMETSDGVFSADYFYRKIIPNEVFKPLVGIMSRNLASALADEAQQALNRILSDDPFEINIWLGNPANYKQYPFYLQRALELIGEGNKLYSSLLAKKYYFEGYNLYFDKGAKEEKPSLRDSFRIQAKKYFLKCIELEPGAAYAYYSIGSLIEQTGNLALADSNILWLEKAIELAPNWKQPYVSIAEVYLNWLTQPEKANEWLMYAYALDSTSYLLLQEISWVRQCQHKPEESNAICRKMISLRPDLPNAYWTLGHTLLNLQGEILESEKYYRKGDEISRINLHNIDSTDKFYLTPHMLKTRRAEKAIQSLKMNINNEKINVAEKSWCLTALAESYVQILDFENAKKAIHKVEEICTDEMVLTRIELIKGNLQLLQGSLVEAEQTLLKALNINEANDDAWINIWTFLGCIKALQNKLDEAEAFFKKAVNFNGGNTANICWETAWFYYGKFLLDQNRDKEAYHAFDQAKILFPKGWYSAYGFALYEAKKGNKEKALDQLEISLNCYYPIPKPIIDEPLFKEIRKTKRFKAMMEKNFPKG